MHTDIYSNDTVMASCFYILEQKTVMTRIAVIHLFVILLVPIHNYKIKQSKKVGVSRAQPNTGVILTTSFHITKDQMICAYLGDMKVHVICFFF